MIAFLWKMHDISYFTRMLLFMARKYLAVQIIFFFPHIQCECIVAFSYQAKKKQLKIKRLLPMNSFVHTKKLYISEPNWLPILIAYFPWKASYVSYEHSNCWILHVNEYIYRRTNRRISWTILWCALLWKYDENERKWEREKKKHHGNGIRKRKS